MELAVLYGKIVPATEAKQLALQSDMALYLKAFAFEELAPIAEFCVQQGISEEELETLDPSIFADAIQLTLVQRGALVKYARVKKAQMMKKRQQLYWEQEMREKEANINMLDINLQMERDYGDQIQREMLERYAKSEYDQLPLSVQISVRRLLNKSQPQLWQQMNWVQRLAITKKCAPHVASNLPCERSTLGG